MTKRKDNNDDNEHDQLQHSNWCESSWPENSSDTQNAARDLDPKIVPWSSFQGQRDEDDDDENDNDDKDDDEDDDEWRLWRRQDDDR